MTVNLFHPVTKESAEKFVAETTTDDITDDERAHRVNVILTSAAQNRQYRDQLPEIEQVRLLGTPVASYNPDSDDDQ